MCDIIDDIVIAGFMKYVLNDIILEYVHAYQPCSQSCHVIDVFMAVCTKQFTV